MKLETVNKSFDNFDLQLVELINGYYKQGFVDEDDLFDLLALLDSAQECIENARERLKFFDNL